MKYQKALNNLDDQTVAELEGLDVDSLKQRVVQASSAIQTAELELEENPEYQSLKESLKDVTSAFKELRKRQNSIIAICLHNLESKGK